MTTTIEIERSALGYSTDAQANAFSVFLAAYLDREMGGEHRVRLGDGERPPEGYGKVIKDAWEDWCNDARVPTIRRGTYSRTGKTYGNVDEGLGVLVRLGNYTEILFAPERWDESARSRIGGTGAFVDQEPAQEEIDAAVARARAHVGEAITVRRRGCRAAPRQAA